jgi:hypothetical protein
MCVSEGTIVRKTTCILGLHPRNITAIVSRRQLIDTNFNPKWATSSKAPCSNILFYAIKNIVEKWWVKEARVPLNWKEVCSFWVSRKVYKQHAKHFLRRPSMHVNLFWFWLLFWKWFILVKCQVEIKVSLFCSGSSKAWRV